MQIPEDALVVVADGASALVLRNRGVGEIPDLRVDRTFEAAEHLRSDREGGTDRPGRLPATGARRGGPEITSPKARAETAHLKDVAAFLNACAAGPGRNSFVLILGPKALGTVRAALSPRARKHVIAEIEGEFRHATVDAIDARLRREAANGGGAPNQSRRSS